ncbi:MAG: endolytic transglycosylase MltG [bacterium]
MHFKRTTDPDTTHDDTQEKPLVLGSNGAWYQEWLAYDQALPTAFLCGVLFFLVYFLTYAAPTDFPTGSYVKIESGQTYAQIAHTLKNKHIIRSTFLFELTAKLYHGKPSVTAGEYFFSGPETVLTVGKRLARADRELTSVRVTLPEGVNTKEIAVILAKKIPDFDAVAFLQKAQNKEGYLFPDTYFFLPGENSETILASLETNFKNHVDDSAVEETLRSFGKPLNQIIAMASLLEKEAADSHSRRVIAGILWKRIAIGMPLQVDAVFPYILGKNTFQLTISDLKIDSPYNTYTNKGLPPGPIANPSLDAILAAATPIKSKYLFYLSDMQSNLHYSATYAEQLTNQHKYLQN